MVVIKRLLHISRLKYYFPLPVWAEGNIYNIKIIQTHL